MSLKRKFAMKVSAGDIAKVWKLEFEVEGAPAVPGLAGETKDGRQFYVGEAYPSVWQCTIVVPGEKGEEEYRIEGGTGTFPHQIHLMLKELHDINDPRSFN